MNIYQVATEYKSFVNDMLMKEELDESNVIQFNQLEGMLEDKAIAIASLIKNLEAEEESIEKAIKSMCERGDKVLKKKLQLTNFLKSTLETCGMNEISKSPYFKIKIKKNPPKVMIKKDEKIDEKYITKKIDSKINLGLIKRDLENGVKLDYATLVQDSRIEIK
jgi:hypothetical protein